MNDKIREFYDKSADFCKYIQGHELSENDIDRILSMLMGLYISAINLPEKDTETEEASSGRHESDQGSIRFAKDFPVSYFEIFNPLEDEAPVGGELFDDFHDIVKDLRDGMIEYEDGNIGNAVYEWKFGVRHHWGTHAVDAIKTLHWIQNV